MGHPTRAQPRRIGHWPKHIQATLQREPRSFVAFQTLSAISEARKDWKGAYEAWRKVLEIDPKTPGGEERLKDLKRRALGEEA